MASMPKVIENPNSTIYMNFLAGTGCEKLYLDTRTADVLFVFNVKNDDREEIPAHKSILSAISPVFDAMLYGPAKENGDIEIVDSTADAFREFLQFFYLTKLELTTENLLEVMNLGKQYMLDDCLSACSEFCEATLTLDNMCWGYELALLFDLDNLREFCEQKISTNPKEIFQSKCFLNCDLNLLRTILQLNSLECDESVVFDSCIAWAKRTCTRNVHKSKKANNLRSQLDSVFHDIRFGEFTHKDFHDRYRLYDGFFTLEEFKDITMMIASKEYRPDKFNRDARSIKQPLDHEMLVCDRKALNPIWYKVSRCQQSNVCLDKTIFQSNSSQQLRKVSCSVKFLGINAVTKMTIKEYPNGDGDEGNLLFFARISICSSERTLIELPSSIKIKADVKYEIEFELEAGHIYSSQLVRNVVEMDKGTVLKFFGEQYGMQSLVKALHFTR